MINVIIFDCYDNTHHYNDVENIVQDKETIKIMTARLGVFQFDKVDVKYMKVYES